MLEFERLYVKIIGDSNLDRTVDRDSRKLSGFEKKLSAMFAKYGHRQIDVDIEEQGAAEAAAALKGVDAAADALPNQVEMNVDVDAGGALSKIGALRLATIGSDGLIGGFNLASKTAHNVFILAIPLAIGGTIAALQPLAGGAGIGGSVVASVATGFGLIALTASQTFSKRQVENGKFVAATDATLTRSQQNLVNHLNRAASRFGKAFDPANEAFNRFAAHVVDTAATTFPSARSGDIFGNG
jgi:hypothetical protein